MVVILALGRAGQGRTGQDRASLATEPVDGRLSLSRYCSLVGPTRSDADSGCRERMMLFSSPDGRNLPSIIC